MTATADPWLSFLDGAIWGLEEAGRRLRMPAKRAHYERLQGWFRRPSQVEGRRNIRVPDETAISGALEELFEEIIVEQAVHGKRRGEQDLRRFQIATEKRRGSRDWT